MVIAEINGQRKNPQSTLEQHSTRKVTPSMETAVVAEARYRSPEMEVNGQNGSRP